MFDSIDQGICLLSFDFIILDIDDRALRTDGRQRDAVIGRSYWDAYPECEHTALGQSIVEAMRKRSPRRIEQAHTLSCGGVAWLETRCVPVPDGNLLLLVRDITDQHREAERLRHSERAFRQLGETISEVFYIHELDEARISYVSKAYERVWGRPRAELYEDLMSFTRVIHPDDRAKVTAAVARQRAGYPTDTEYRLCCEDGSERIIHDRAFLGRDPVSESTRVFGLATDITEYRRALAEKDLLAREIDHRVKNSLMIVSSLLAIQRRASASCETRAALEEAGDRVTAIARVHERLHKSHQLGVIAFGAYLEQLCADVSASLRGDAVVVDVRAVAVELSAEVALPLALIANELVTNAFKHGCAAGATRISIVLEQTSDRLTLTVDDDGAGLPPGAPSGAGSLGFRLFGSMARQLGGTAIFPQPGGRACFRVEIPHIGREVANTGCGARQVQAV
ncbi:sensor histidine kinase [Sphingomonas sp. PAMC 26605]|uniref:sensor histidine kinase n=1 Tax=Sphingomonas sp. PAMC 26605 TaxID=1112214 RepID=UPI00026CD12D|nr:histidine kinase dimerization/phosphoacceptor domain -containing protein [Sphingomonas sp. PAMC 26605]